MKIMRRLSLGRLRLYQRASETISPTRTLTSAQRLPPELLHPIIDLLILPIYPSDFHFAGLLPMEIEWGFKILSRYDALAPLRCALLVCKSWRQVGTPLLYSTIFLSSHTQVRLLGRTLRRNASLASLVRRLFVLQSSIATPLPRLKRFRLPIKGTDLQQVLVSTLHACTSLESLTFTLYSGPSLFPVWNQDLYHKSSVGSRLRVLSICGDWAMTFRSLSPQVLPLGSPFPVLEVLLLHITYIHSQLPHLRSLHTLRVSYPKLSPSMRAPGLIFSSSELPSLKTLSLLGIRAPVSFTGDAIRNLESLWVDGKEEFEAFQLGVRQGATNNLKHVSVTLGSVRSAGFSTLDLPPRIESLAFDLNFLAMTPGFLDFQPIDTYGLEAFHNTSHSWSRNRRNFKMLIIEYGGYPDQDTTDFDLLVMKIRNICELAGITVVLRRWGREEYVERGRIYMYDWPIGLFKEMDILRSH